MGARPNPPGVAPGGPVKFLARFQRLERSRQGRGPGRSGTGERFQAIEPAAPLPDVHTGKMERFAPPVDVPLELAPRSHAQPFVRCPACGVDSALGTRRCQCGKALDTLEVVAFNTELWDRHRAEQTAHESVHRQAREAELVAAAQLQRERQALGESIAQEIAARERGGQLGASAAVTVALVSLGVLALILLPRGPVARFIFAVLLGALAVRAVVAWVRSRSPDDPEDQSSVHH
jgi:flagellar motor protein MotB